MCIAIIYESKKYRRKFEKEWLIFKNLFHLSNKMKESNVEFRKVRYFNLTVIIINNNINWSLLGKKKKTLPTDNHDKAVNEPWTIHLSQIIWLWEQER